ncbi:MAG: YbaK/EbsC family protein [Anaerolineales bacterium]|jgi:Cys-tRNA(Pro)/Cys-tRNA(Cys) deacylase
MDQDTNNTTPVTRALDALNVPYQFFRHPGQVRSLEQAARERGQRPDQIVRSIVFRLPEEEFIMVLVAGPEQISWHDLREYLGLSRMTMANKEQVLERTGFPPGAVSPFGLPQPMRILVDKSVLQEEIVSIGSGVRNTTVILRRDDLMQALGEVEVVTVSGAG